MQRRAFLQWLCVGIGVASTATTANALGAIRASTSLKADENPKPQPSVATPEDLDSARVEDVWYGHWRRVNRRHYRRVSRRVYRRRYY
jgi:hypothetical protein